MSTPFDEKVREIRAAKLVERQRNAEFMAAKKALNEASLAVNGLAQELETLIYEAVRLTEPEPEPKSEAAE